jgi:hypothetical protein
MQPLVITRSELYGKVSFTPMTRLGKEYGVNESAVTKAREKLSIPRPSKGHWTRIRNGNNPRKMSA